MRLALLVLSGAAVTLTRDEALPYAIGWVLLLLASAFFSGSEAALFSLDRVTLDKLEDDPSASARAVRALLAAPRRLLVVLLVGNEFVNIALSTLTASLVFTLAGPESAELWWLNILIVVPILLLLGDIGPKALGVRAGLAWARLVALPLRVFSTLIAPARAVLEGAAWVVLRVVVALSGGRLRGLLDTADPLPGALEEAQFRALVKLSADHGSIRRDEADLIHRVFDLGDTPVSKLMTARGDIHSLPLDATWEDMVSRARASKFSRLPVHLGTLDNVRGVLLTKDLLRHRFTGVVPSRADLVALLKPAYFVPPGKAAGELLREFQRKRHHMAVVLDEFGTVQGLVTMQDILSALFRPVSATGQEHRGPRAERLADGVFRVPARLEIEEWNRQLHPPLPTGETWSTVAGYIFHLFGRLPQKGEQVADEAWTFTVSGMTGTRVTQVTAARRAPKPPRAAR